MYATIGNFDEKRAGHTQSYYNERYTFMDLRGNLKISPLSHWGYENMIITASHDFTTGEWTEPTVLKSVIVDDYAWITSRCVLYNCHIGHHAIVAIGSIVSNMEVEPYTVIAGNPAQVIVRWDGKKWNKIA